MKTVSIITLSQYNRIENLFILKDMLKEQTYYDKIIEWVIIDGSKIKNENMNNKIENLRTQIDIPIEFIDHEEGIKIGGLRNKANNKAKGDILICCDDDDYYPPERVQEAYDKLINSDLLLAGCSPTFMYDYVLDKQYKFLQFWETHSPNNAFAFKREYLINHSHDETVLNDEEISFTNNWKEPLIKLNALKTVNVSSHIQNTFNKRQLIVSYYNDYYKQMFEYDNCVIPEKYYKRIKESFIKQTKSKYDIVYFCGESIHWDPNDESLGGSEQAVKYLTKEWVKVGKKIAVYGNVNECNYEGVDYINWRRFPYHEEFNTIIVWRLFGIYCLHFHTLKVQKMYWDLHDNMKITPQTMKMYNLFIRNNRPFDKIMFKSNYHKTEFEEIHKKLNDNEYLIIPNGLRIEEFNIFNEKYKNEIKNPYRFCYCSSYSRGLDNILSCVWPIIVKNEPRAELHIYYGMIHETTEFQNRIRNLISLSKNVMDHGREPLEMIIREKKLSTYQLYLNDHAAEIDCINIREGILCDCIPIISNNSVYKERDGLKININFNTSDVNELTLDLQNVGNLLSNVVKYYNNTDILKMISKLQTSNLLISWKFVADLWLKDENYITKNSINCYDNTYLLNKMKSKYDIVYYGGNCTKWDSNDYSELKGSEQAVKYLSEYWANKGYSVAVYTNIVERTLNGVDYIHWSKFDYLLKYNIIICWRLCSLEYISKFSTLNYEKLFLDIHDNTPVIKYYANVFNIFKDYIDTIIFKSEYSKKEFEKYCNIMHNSVIIPNGIRYDFFNNVKYSDIIRDKNNFIYASCYTRGLEKILLHVFPSILKINPEAKLFICYGTKLLGNSEFSTYILDLISSSQNVIHLDSIKLEELIELKHKCMFHLYPSTSDTETDCISIRESLLSGCIPLISNEGVFNERSGIHYDIDFNNNDSLKNVGTQIGLLSMNMTIEKYNEIIVNMTNTCDNIYDWDYAGKKWIENFKSIYNVQLSNLGKYNIFPKDHIKYLEKLKNTGFKPKIVYDIGCCVLHWTKEIKKLYNDVEVILFDAIDDAEFLYTDYKYHIGVLSNEDDKIVKWYQNLDEPAGNSYYREIGNKYSEKLFPINNYMNKITCKLDTIVEKNNYPYPDIVKIDTQGSEIDIIMGGINTIKHAKYLIVELQHTQYNEGAYLADESIKIIENLGFKCIAEKFNETPVDGDYCFENILI